MDFDLYSALQSFFAIIGAVVLMYQAAAAFYRGAPLRMVVNPYRRQWLMAGVGVASVAYSGIALTANNQWDPPSIFRELGPLVSEGKTPIRVITGALFLLIGLALIGSVIFCWRAYPRDPMSFNIGKQSPDSAAKNVRRALQHYTTRSGGLEYAAVIVLPPTPTPPPTVEQLLASQDASGADSPPYRLLEWLSEGELKDISKKRHLGHVDHKLFAANRTTWLGLALAAHPRAREQAIPCLQSNLGDVTLIQTRTRFGGLLLEYLYPAKEGEPDFLLFGVTISAGDSEGNLYYEHFAMLRRAVRFLLTDKYALGPTIFPTELAVSAAPPPPSPVESVPPEAEPDAATLAAAQPVAVPSVAQQEQEENPEDPVGALIEPPTAADDSK